MKTKEVSIIVPIYNVEKYLSKCLESLITQTYKQIKIWAISDGSPDNSICIARKYAELDNRIIVIDKPNGGYGSVLEYAIRNMSSEFFLICDPDDWLEPFAIEKLLSSAEKNDSDIVIGNRYDVYNDGDDDTPNFIDVIRNNSWIDTEREYSGKECAKAVFCEVSPHSKLYKREICKNIVFEHNVSYTDFTLFVVALNNCRRVSFLKDALSFYLCDRPGNTATDARAKKFAFMIKVWNSTYSQICNSNNEYILYKMYSNARSILLQYANYPKKGDVVQYAEEICDLFKKISSKKKSISSVIKSDKLFFRLITNDITREIAFKVYVYLKRGK